MHQYNLQVSVMLVNLYGFFIEDLFKILVRAEEIKVMLQGFGSSKVIWVESDEQFDAMLLGFGEKCFRIFRCHPQSFPENRFSVVTSMEEVK